MDYMVGSTKVPRCLKVKTYYSKLNPERLHPWSLNQRDIIYFEQKTHPQQEAWGQIFARFSLKMSKHTAKYMEKMTCTFDYDCSS